MSYKTAFEPCVQGCSVVVVGGGPFICTPPDWDPLQGIPNDRGKQCALKVPGVPPGQTRFPPYRIGCCKWAILKSLSFTQLSPQKLRMTCHPVSPTLKVCARPPDVCEEVVRPVLLASVLHCQSLRRGVVGGWLRDSGHCAIASSTAPTGTRVGLPQQSQLREGELQEKLPCVLEFAEPGRSVKVHTGWSWPRKRHLGS